MTDRERIKFAAAMTDETDEAVLSAYLNMAESIALHQLYPFGGDDSSILPDTYEYDMLQIAVYLINTRGAEGETGHTEGGISRTYSAADVPQALLARIVPKAVVL